MTIDKSFIDKVESMAKPEQMELGGRLYTTKGVVAVLAPACLDALISQHGFGGAA